MASSSADPPDMKVKAFQVHLQTLRDFADELRGQIEALGAVRNTSATLDSLEVKLGLFTEADSLVARHTVAVTQLKTLLVGIEDAIHFAEGVTDVVTTQFAREADRFAASIAAVTGPSAGTSPNGTT